MLKGKGSKGMTYFNVYIFFGFLFSLMNFAEIWSLLNNIRTVLNPIVLISVIHPLLLFASCAMLAGKVNHAYEVTLISLCASVICPLTLFIIGYFILPDPTENAGDIAIFTRNLIIAIPTYIYFKKRKATIQKQSY